MDIDKVEAGHELDRLIAEKAMGWRKVFDEDQGSGMWILWVKQDGQEIYDQELPKFSADIAAAWEVLAAVAAGPACCITIETRTFPDRRVMFHVELNPATIGEGEPEYYTQSFSAPLAICRAALKAVEA